MTLFAGALLLTLLSGSDAWGDRNPLPVLEQAEVNQAINKGVHYLRTHMNPKVPGSWSPNNSYTVGYAALPGLTLLECGLPANDPQIQAAANHVRRAMTSKTARLDRTYELALSILFLDRLGDARDKGLIQSMAARLIAGQTASGGWSYKCPDLSTSQARDILTLLQTLQPPPKPGLDLTERDPNRSPDHLPGTGRDPKPAEEITQGSYPPATSTPRPGYCIKMGDDFRPEPKVAQEMGPTPPPKPPVKVTIPPHYAGLPVFQDPNRPPLPDPPGNHTTPGVTDNSNTQFAILALWAARRHGVPMDRSLNLIVKRFRTSQNADGRWGYRYALGGGAGGSNAMTCVGLLGLAIGHGVAQVPDAGQRAQDDEMMKKGFLALYGMIGQPQQRMKDLPMENLYFLWSVERVAVLYNLPTILDKDWYRWGAEILVANQAADGSWLGQKYPGFTPQIDTCLALLFLKRANLARDLSRQLPYSPGELNDELLTRLPNEKPPTTPTPHEGPENESVKPPETAVQPSPPELPPGTERAPRDASSSHDPAPAAEEEPEPRSNWKFLAFVIGLAALLLAFGVVVLIVRSHSADEEKRRMRRPRRGGPHRLKRATRD